MTDKANLNPADPAIDRRLFIKLDDLFNGIPNQASASIRLSETLKANHMLYVGDLYHHPKKGQYKGNNETALLSTFNFGLKLLNELKRFLTPIGLDLKEEPQGTTFWPPLTDAQWKPVSKDELQQILSAYTPQKPSPIAHGSQKPISGHEPA